jgi:hypothetical protein
VIGFEGLGREDVSVCVWFNEMAGGSDVTGGQGEGGQGYC